MKTARQGDLEVVGSYRFPHEALVAKSALEAFGVSAWVLDEYLADHKGGVKLVVRTPDGEAAREILAGDHSSDLEAVPESHLPPSPDEICPRCGAERVGIARSRMRGVLPERLLVLASALFGGGERAARRCSACGHVER